MMFRPKRHFDFMRLCLLLASIIWATVAAPSTAVAQDTAEPPSNTIWTATLSNSNPNGFDTPNIMSALSNPHSDLVLLSAHRGLHALAGLSQAAGVPENSLRSIGLAAEAGWEMIELDVKLTSDGVPILSHDRTWGRQWCGLSPVPVLQPYDPFTPPGSTFNDAANPAANGTTLSNTRSFLGSTVLRDSVSLLNPFLNHGCTGYNNFFGEYPPTLADALDYIAKNKIRMVVLLDIQGADIAHAALNVVDGKFDDAGRPFFDSVVFKIPATVFPNGTSDFVNTFGGSFTRINFIPVFNTANVTPVNATITDAEDGGFDLSDVGNFGLGGESGILNWLQHFENDIPTSPNGTSGRIHVVAVEVGYKEPNGILTTVLQNARFNLRNGAPMTVGEFNPVGEYYPNGDTSQTPQFFRSSNGTCCDTLNQYLYNNPNGTGPIDPNQPVDHSDQRTDLNFLLNQGFQYFITDDPSTARSQLISRSLRNICYMQPSPTQNCSSGGAAIPACLPDDPSCQGQGPADPCTNTQCYGPAPNPCDPSVQCIATDPSAPPTHLLIATPPPAPSRRVAYFDSWSIYANAFYPKALDTQGIAGKLTTINYAFENIDPVNLTCLAANKAGSSNESDTSGNDGASDAWADYQMGYTSSNSVDGSTDAWEQPLKGDFNQLKQLKAKYPNLQVLVTLGGWTYSKFFSDVAATDASRKKFVSSFIDLYIKGNLPVLAGSPAGGSGAAAGVFDGFDIDWEYPGSNNGHAGNHFGPQDTANYTALLAELRSQLDALGGKHYLLTAAVPAGPTEINLLQIPQINQYLDYADIMTYDFHGAFEVNGPTNFQAPLFETHGDPDMERASLSTAQSTAGSTRLSCQ